MRGRTAPDFDGHKGSTGANMNMEDEEYSPFGGYGSGCDIHGEDFLRECTMCGIEFCAACFPNSALCPDCAAQADLGDDEEEAEPSEEEKDLLLLEGFNDDEPESSAEETPAPPPAKRAPGAAKVSPKAAGKAAAKKPAKPAPKKAPVKAAPKTKAAPKAESPAKKKR